MSVIDVRDEDYITVLDHCKDCNTDFICEVRSRHNCGCYLKDFLKERDKQSLKLLYWGLGTWFIVIALIFILSRLHILK